MLTGSQREALAAKFALLRSAAVDRTRAQIVALDRELAARGMFRSGHRITKAWEYIQTNGMEMAHNMLDASFTVGVRDAGDAAGVVRDEYLGFLRSWNPAASSGSAAADVTETLCMSTATSMASRIDDEARSRLFDALAKEPKPVPSPGDHRVDVWTRRLKRTAAFVGALGTLGTAIWKLAGC